MTNRAVAFTIILRFVAGCSEDDSPALAEPESAYQPPTAQRERPVAGYSAQPVNLADPGTGTPFEAPVPIWPAPAIAEIALGAPAGWAFGDDGATLVGGLPVRVDGDLDGAFGAAAPARVVVESLGHAATTLPGIEGVVVRLSRADGIIAASRARITVGYGAFRWAHGGDWAQRLALFPAMNRYRMKTVNSETGGKLDVTYAMPDCVRGTRVPDQNALHNNALRCYPVKWTPEDRTSPINDFFHKYVVSGVAEADLTMPGAPAPS